MVWVEGHDALAVEVIDWSAAVAEGLCCAYTCCYVGGCFFHGGRDGQAAGDVACYCGWPVSVYHASAEG